MAASFLATFLFRVSIGPGTCGLTRTVTFVLFCFIFLHLHHGAWTFSPISPMFSPGIPLVELLGPQCTHPQFCHLKSDVYHICHRLSMACGSHINVHMVFHDFLVVHVAVAQRQQRSTRPCMRHHKTVSSPERCFKAYWKSCQIRVCPKLGEKIWL